jgi:hypothetical protein
MVFAALGFAPQRAMAIPFSGSVDYVGTHVLNADNFVLGTMFTITPPTIVLTSTGSVGALVTPGSIISHASPITYAPPTFPITPLWSHAASGVVFNLTAFAVTNITPGPPLSTLELQGTGVFSCAAGVNACTAGGFMDTPGAWVMTLNKATGVVVGTFSSSSIVPEPTLLALFGLGAIGLASRIRRRR